MIPRLLLVAGAVLSGIVAKFLGGTEDLSSPKPLEVRLLALNLKVSIFRCAELIFAYILSSVSLRSSAVSVGTSSASLNPSSIFASYSSRALTIASCSFESWSTGL